MAWIIKHYSFCSPNTDPLNYLVEWHREGNANPGTDRRGAFEHTVVASATHATIVTDIEVKINADTGIFT